MESTPIIILKRPNTVVKHDDQAVENTKTHSSKTLEEKLAKYVEARRRILGSDSEEEKTDAKSQDGTEKQELDKEVTKDTLVEQTKPKASPPSVPKASPQKAEQKSSGITPLMSIEFKQSSALLLENAMESMNLGQAMKKTADETTEQHKKSLFLLESNGVVAMNSPQSSFHHAPHHHFVGPAVPNHFHLRHYVNNSILHPYANSNMNHILAHHYPSQLTGPRFNPNCLGSLTSGQVKFVPNAPPLSLNVPPPGYFHQPVLTQNPVQFPPQISQPIVNHHTYPETAARQGKKPQHLDINFS